MKVTVSQEFHCLLSCDLAGSPLASENIAHTWIAFAEWAWGSCRPNFHERRILPARFFYSRVNCLWGNYVSQVLRHHVIITSQEIQKVHSVLIGSKTPDSTKIQVKTKLYFGWWMHFPWKTESVFYLKNSKGNIK